MRIYYNLTGDEIMKNLTVEEGLNHESLNFAYKVFLKNSGCNWTFDQYKQSLKNQDYLKFIVFKDGTEIVGIISYSTENPWNRNIFDIEYSIDDETKNIMLDYVKQKKEIMMYRFKYYYKDGSTEISLGYATKPEYLYNDFDGFMDSDDFYSLSEKNLTTKDILKMTFEIYKNFRDFKKEFYRLEIIEDPTGRVIDSLEISKEDSNLS